MRTGILALAIAGLLAGGGGGCAPSYTPDDDTSADDDTGGGDDDDTGPADETICDIQMGWVDEGTEVWLHDVIATSPFSEAPAGFFVQEPDGGCGPQFAGIFVHLTEPLLVNSLEPAVDVGTALAITGIYTELYEFSVVEVERGSQVEVLGDGVVPTPANIGACSVNTTGLGAETYEGVLLAIPDVNVTNPNPDEPDDYQEFEVGGCLRVDDLFLSEFEWPAPTIGTHYTTLFGPLYYGNGETKLVPRTPYDFVQ